MSDWAPRAIIACEKCGGATAAINTRGRDGKDVIHRQRRCAPCDLTFSTFESRLNPTDAKRAAHALERLETAIAELHRLRAELGRT